MKPTLWDSTKLDDLLSTKQEARSAAEVYFESLGPEAASEVMDSLNAETVFWQKIVVGEMAFLICLVLALLFGLEQHLLTFGMGTGLILVLTGLVFGPTLVNWKKWGAPLKALTLALLYLDGDLAANTIMSDWASTDTPLADNALR